MSLRFYAGLPDNLSPAGGFPAHESIEPGGCAALDVRPLVGEAPTDVGHVENLAKLGIEPFHDRPRRRGGDHDAVPERNVHPGITEFGERGYVGKQTVTLRG